MDDKIKKQEEEEKVLEGGKSISQNLEMTSNRKNFKSLERSRTPVEDRLRLYLEKYNNNIQEKKKEKESEEEREMRNPQINEISQQIVATLEVK